MTLGLILTGIASGILLFLVFLQRQEIRNISRQLKEIKDQDTNVLVHSNGSGRLYAELINEINLLLREMQRSRVTYQQKNHALEQMMTNISHDLRTPLTSALGYIHLLQGSALTEEEKERELAIVERRLIRLEELIDSFFEFSQTISSEKAPEMSEVNIIAVLEESIAHYYDDYLSRNREILFECRQHRQIIPSNKKMLLRIFDNLIGNALKHGVGDLTVSVDTAADIQIMFANRLDDPGLETDRLFDEFYTTDISRTKGNTGLGLAIVKQFTELLGGSVSVQNTDGLFLLTVCIPFNRK